MCSDLYTPAVTIARRLDDDEAAAIELAAWKKRVREAWPRGTDRARRVQRHHGLPGARLAALRARSPPSLAS